ncbi:hypothetical protein D9M68_599500 [compost metagenome]
MKSKRSIIFFDGVCNLCHGAVQFIIRRDAKNVFHFASLQSELAKELLLPHGVVAAHHQSIILLSGGKVYQYSTAALRIAQKLRWPWPLFYGFIIIPPFIRDAVYRFIANNRYHWFGKTEHCWLPEAGLKEKFL